MWISPSWFTLIVTMLKVSFQWFLTILIDRSNYLQRWEDTLTFILIAQHIVFCIFNKSSHCTIFIHLLSWKSIIACANQIYIPQPEEDVSHLTYQYIYIFFININSQDDTEIFVRMKSYISENIRPRTSRLSDNKSYYFTQVKHFFKFVDTSFRRKLI